MNENIKQTIMEALKSTNRQGIEAVIDYLENSDYFTAPASTKYHSCYEGGLADHSLNVYNILQHKNKVYKLELPLETVAICGLLHDICKCNFYAKGTKNVKENGVWIQKEIYEVKDDNPLGHGEKSVILLQDMIKLTTFELYAIRWHMGFTDSKEPHYTLHSALEMLPGIIALHTSDIEATYLIEGRKKSES
jgi:hypothetical protein